MKYYKIFCLVTWQMSLGTSLATYVTRPLSDGDLANRTLQPLPVWKNFVGGARRQIAECVNFALAKLFTACTAVTNQRRLLCKYLHLQPLVQGCATLWPAGHMWPSKLFFVALKYVGPLAENAIFAISFLANTISDELFQALEFTCSVHYVFFWQLFSYSI